jgi:hypothetical protein
MYVSGAHFRPAAQKNCCDLMVGAGLSRMNIILTPEQEQIVNDELKSGHFRSAEEVIAKALVALRKKGSLVACAG